VCDLVYQTGCPSGEQCVLDFGTVFPKCVPDTGTGQLADCATAGECNSGYDCFWNICIQYCYSAGDCKNAGFDCDYMVGDDVPVGICSD